MSNASTRYHLGRGPLALLREVSVFINCPFDAAYQPVFDAIIFSTLCCGFFPRCALETGTAAQSRIHRILAAMRDSKYSIHDLSSCCGEGQLNLARFNMPLELGMAMYQRFSSTRNEASHDWLVLVPKGHIYARFVSDLAGYDPTEYDGTASTVVPAVMSWLATRPDAVRTPTPQAVVTALPVFIAARANLCTAWCDQVPWSDILIEGMRVAQKAGLIPDGVVEGP